MPGQLPSAGAVFLDHIAHFVPHMEAAAHALERCGFRLTPFTLQTNREGGAAVPVGTGNRCAMLRTGYVELLAATADTPLSRQLRERLTRHTGLHLAAFSAANAAGERDRLAAAGFAVQPLVEMRRPVASAGGSEDARFTIARIAPGSMAEGRMQFLTHHTERLVWRPDYLDHPNGARALTALWISAADPAEPAARFARFTGRPARRLGEITEIALDRGALRFATPSHLEAEFGVAPGPPLPYLTAYEIEVADPGLLPPLLNAAGQACRVIAGGLAVHLPAALGGTIIFRTGASDAPTTPPR